MVKSRRRKTCQETIAAWLYDAYGMPNEKQSEFNWEAADLQRFMKAHGFEWHAINVNERTCNDVQSRRPRTAQSRP